jgi:tetratricopeptide (TPR) repeat protein
LGLIYGVTVPFTWLRRPERVESAAREVLRLAEEMSLALWQAWGRIDLGWALSQAEPAAGIEDIEAGLADAERIGVGRMRPLHLTHLADALSRSGRHIEALKQITEAFAAHEWGGDVALSAELHRTQGGVALRAGTDAAEAHLRRAIAIAREQTSPTLELRAARDLARLWAERGERQKAHDLLAPIYARFTEGFDTPDLIEAKALLDELR